MLKEAQKEVQEAIREMPVNKNIEKMAEFAPPPPMHHNASVSSNKS